MGRMRFSTPHRFHLRRGDPNIRLRQALRTPRTDAARERVTAVFSAARLHAAGGLNTARRLRFPAGTRIPQQATFERRAGQVSAKIGSNRSMRHLGRVLWGLIRRVFNPGPGTFQFFKNNGISLSSASFSQTNKPTSPQEARNIPRPSSIPATGTRAYRPDGGGTFHYVNPYTLFPATVHGAIGAAIYDPSRDLFFWLLRYNTTGGCNPRGVCTGNNIYPHRGSQWPQD